MLDETSGILIEYVNKKYENHSINFLSFSLGSNSLLSYVESLTPDRVVLIAPIDSLFESYRNLKRSFQSRNWWANLVPDWYLDRVVENFVERNNLNGSASPEIEIYSDAEVLFVYGSRDSISPFMPRYKNTVYPSATTISLIYGFEHNTLSVPYESVRSPIYEFLIANENL